MTSANVTHYAVRDRDGKVVFEGSQHACCKDTIRGRLAALPDKDSLTLHATWLDENEVDQEAIPIPLEDYLAGKRLVFPSTMGWELHEENLLLKQALAKAHSAISVLRRDRACDRPQPSEPECGCLSESCLHCRSLDVLREIEVAIGGAEPRDTARLMAETIDADLARPGDPPPGTLEDLLKRRLNEPSPTGGGTVFDVAAAVVEKTILDAKCHAGDVPSVARKIAKDVLEAANLGKLDGIGEPDFMPGKDAERLLAGDLLRLTDGTWAEVVGGPSALCSQREGTLIVLQVATDGGETRIVTNREIERLLHDQEAEFWIKSKEAKRRTEDA
jgi:hypothetical protein